MNTIPTIAAGFPSRRAAAWIGQGRAFERRFPDASATGAPRCYHPFGQRARQRTGGRFVSKLQSHGAESIVCIGIDPAHAPQHLQETKPCRSTRHPEKFGTFR